MGNRENQYFLPGDPPVPLVVRRVARARRISLRISQLDGRVTLSMPPHVPHEEAIAFAREKEDWIRGHLAERPAACDVAFGAHIPFEGNMLEIRAGRGRSVLCDHEAIYVPGAPDAVAARVRGFLRENARARLVAASDHYADMVGRRYARITLRDTRSRWGSCSSVGALMYSWRLIMAPPAILDYVAAHEVAHLIEMNHSPAFWAVVHRLMGDHRPARAWLHEHGGDLHRYRFEAP